MYFGNENYSGSGEILTTLLIMIVANIIDLEYTLCTEYKVCRVATTQHL